MRRPEIWSGDFFRIAVTLTTDGVPEPVAGAAIRASVRSAQTTEVYVQPTQQSSDTSGANWAAGVVVIEFPSSITAEVPRGEVWLEIQVTRSGRPETWKVPLEGQRGTIP
jgi:hypothetical protein